MGSGDSRAHSPEALARNTTAALFAKNLDACLRTGFPTLEEFRSLDKKSSADQASKWHAQFEKELRKSWEGMQAILDTEIRDRREITDIRYDLEKNVNGTADILVSFSVKSKRYAFSLDECQKINGVWYVFDFDWIGPGGK